MIKFLINFASFVACVGLLAFGGYQTVQDMRLDEMIGEFESALEYAPELPDIPGSNPEDGDPELPGDGDGEGDAKPNPDDKPEQGGNEDMGGNEDQPGDSDDKPEQGGNDDDMGGNEDVGGGESEPEGPNPDPTPDPNPTPDPDPTPNPDPDPSPAPGEGDEDNTPPANETLSTEEAKNAFGDLYDNHDADFAEVKKEMVTGMINGFLGTGNGGGSDNQPSEPDEDEPEEDVEIDFGAEFNPDEFEPDEEEPEEGGTTEIEEMIGGIVNTYVDNLFAEIENQQAANAGASEEEAAAARDEFIEREAEAFAGLVNVVNNPGTTEEESEQQLIQSVDAVLNSTVVLGTVSQSVENNPELTETIQEATSNMNEEVKNDIQNKIEEAMNANPEKEQQYKDLANLFGITFGESTPEVPEGFNPEDYLGG